MPLPARIAATTVSPASRLPRVRSKRAATRMNGAARTRRLLSRIEATAEADGWSVGCGWVAGPRAGHATPASTPTTVATPSATQHRQIVRRSGRRRAALCSAGAEPGDVRAATQFCGSHCEIE